MLRQFPQVLDPYASVGEADADRDDLAEIEVRIGPGLLRRSRQRPGDRNRCREYTERARAL